MAKEGADIIAVDIAGKLPSCVPYPPATEEDLAETVRQVEKTNRRILTSVVDIHHVTKGFGRDVVPGLRSGDTGVGRMPLR